MASPSSHRWGKKNTDLVYLRSLPAEEPVTSTGRVMSIWPEVQAALAAGKKPREIWEAAQRDGLSVPYPQFRVYVSRLRRRDRVHSGPSVLQLAVRQAETAPADAARRPDEHLSDPFHNLRVQREKGQQSGFEYDPFSIGKDLIG